VLEKKDSLMDTIISTKDKKEEPNIKRGEGAIIIFAQMGRKERFVITKVNTSSL